MSESISDTLASDRSLIEALTRLTVAVEGLRERMETLEDDRHRPPCRDLDAAVARLTALEKSSGHFSDLFWKVVAALATAAALALWKVQS